MYKHKLNKKLYLITRHRILCLSVFVNFIYSVFILLDLYIRDLIFV